MKVTPLSLPAVLLGLLLAAIACSGDEEKPGVPEIIRSGGGTESRDSNVSPEIIRSSPGGAGSASLAPAPAATGPSSAGLTVRRTEFGDAQADEAFVVALVQSRPPDRYRLPSSHRGIRTPLSPASSRSASAGTQSA
jgi:hypothetical protein